MNFSVLAIKSARIAKKLVIPSSSLSDEDYFYFRRSQQTLVYNDLSSEMVPRVLKLEHQRAV